MQKGFYSFQPTRDRDLFVSLYSDYLFFNCFSKNYIFSNQINIGSLGFRDRFLVTDNKNKKHVLICTVKFARQRMQLASLHRYS